METTTKTKRQIRLEGQIRDAYAAIATEPGAWVSLTKLRASVIQITHNTFTTLIKAMYAEQAGTGAMNLIPESNQKVLTDWDRYAAVVVGDEPRHLIAIHR